MKILMVCLGNICRSPLAEGILRAKAKGLDLDWKIDSAGTGSWHVGNKPDPRSIAVANQHEIDISYQRAQQFKAAHLTEYDLVLAMDTSNYQNILQSAKTEESRDKVRLILSYLSPHEQRSVPDPYWDDNGFEEVFEMLSEACDVLVKEVNLGG